MTFEDKPEEVVPDFLSYLEGRFAIDREHALAMLGEWIVNYEPAQGRDARVKKVQAQGAQGDLHSEVASAA